MNRLSLALFAILLCVAAPMAQAHEHSHFSLNIGGGYYPHYYAPYYYAPYYSPYYYGYPAYYAPPPTVIYTQPQQTEIITAQPQATIIQQTPSPIVTQTQTQHVAPTTAVAKQTEDEVPTYIDAKGRTCRQFQSVMDGASVNGTACLQPDGTWRTVGE